MITKLPKKLICLIISLIILVAAALPAHAKAEDQVEQTVSEVLSWWLEKNGVADIDQSLAAGAGVSAEWYVLALIGAGERTLPGYASALSEYIDTHTVGAATTRLKLALICHALGINESYVSATSNEAIGAQGIMSLIWGLHLINNGVSSTLFDADILIGEILSARRADGGWSAVGTQSDIDATAMAIQALVPYYEDLTVRGAIDSALDMLSERQLADGGFMSYGVSNPESAAQVLIALSALGIDAEVDERFVKNGSTVIDAILRFRLPDQSFAHIEGGASNANATAQVFLGMKAYLKFLSGGGSVYDHTVHIEDSTDIVTDSTETITTTEPVTDLTTDSSDTVTDTENGDEGRGVSYKPIACAAIVLVCALICICLFAAKKRSVKNFAVILAIGVIAIMLVIFTDISTPEDYYGADITKENAIGRVTMTIRCDSIVGRDDRDFIPSDGIILAQTGIDIAEGDTVYTVLLEAARKYGIQFENNGTAEMAYIAGINYLYEFDHGDLSGWVYLVNGERASVGCGEYVLSDGDRIEWVYSLSYGEDIE